MRPVGRELFMAVGLSLLAASSQCSLAQDTAAPGSAPGQTVAASTPAIPVAMPPAAPVSDAQAPVPLKKTYTVPAGTKVLLQ